LVQAHRRPVEPGRWIPPKEFTFVKETERSPIWLKVLIPFEAEMNEEEGTLGAQLACK